MQKILQGLKHFQEEVLPPKRRFFESLIGGQEPRALFITCGDSRIVPNLITETEPGELFISRQVGNIVPPHGTVYGGVSSTVEYAVGALHVKHIILCGHSDCGAMRAVLQPAKMDALPNVKRWLEFAETARQVAMTRCPHGSDEERLEIVTRENVRVQLRHLETHPLVAVAMAKGELSLHGWVYHIESGQMDAYDRPTDSFIPITFQEAEANFEQGAASGSTAVSHG